MNVVAASELGRAFGQTLAEVRDLLQAQNVRFALIGGIAVGLRAEPRATKDVDLVISVDASRAPDVLADLEGHGFTTVRHGLPGPGAVVRLHRVGPDGVRAWVDLLFEGTDLERSLLDRATTELLFGGVALPVATTEDLILLKLLAHRPQDLLDVRNLISFHLGTLDLTYLRSHARDWEIEAELEQFLAAQ